MGRIAAPPERVPPGQFVTDKFPVLHAGSVPWFDPKTWDLRIYGDVDAPLTLSYAQVRALPSVEVTTDIHCVTTWSKLDAAFKGVPTTHVLDLVRPHPDVRYVVCECEQGFTANVHIEDLRKPASLLAYGYNGKDLTPEHGFPLRMFVPHRYFWKSAKWLRAIRFSKDDERGFWETRGYHNNADPWNEERYGGSEDLVPRGVKF
ncbi:MAG TPA: sulfite oxidase-like oxidoreductase [Candidatus Thermoplasmatota archaeon]|nr:sulfite oxidase-like oxidoreductase [Candidatus Thermoplasmatota archaeon]